MRWATATIPPYVMAGTRFVIAGGGMYLWARWRGAPPASGAHWRGAAIVGALLLLLGNGNVTWAQTRVPSGIAAILVAAAAIWIVLFDWWRPNGQRPRPLVVAGMILGMAGIAILVSAREAPGGARLDTLAVVVLLLSSMAWALGSIVSRTTPSPTSWVQSTGMQMLCGGVMLVAAALATGQARGFDPAAVTARSWLGFAYLVVCGSIIGFTAYMWLLARVSAAKAATYAYVNPVIAVMIGAAVLGERLTPRAITASALSLAGVVLVTLARRPPPEPEPPEAG